MSIFKPLSELFTDTSVARRTFLKGLGAVSISAVAAGCSAKNDDEQSYIPIVNQSNDLVFDKEVKRFYSTGPHNCGTRCKHNLFVKNGRVVKMTSDGDILRAGCKELDESVADAQKRACVRGYGYIKRQYQPDRLKYPLLQTKARGDLTGFKRISWGEAIDRLSGMMNEMITRKEALGYLPIRVFWNIPSLFKKPGASNPNGLGPCISIYGNASFGNIASALWDGAGYDSAYNSSVDMLNSGFLLSWAVDVTSSFGHQGPSYWYYTKAKEAGVPIVVIEAKYSDTAASIATGTTLTYEKNGRSIKGFEIPAIVTVRPGTDCALAAAMCYVIWKNKEYDEEFLRNKCFGFYKGQTVTNESNDETQQPGFLGTLGKTAAFASNVKFTVSNFFDPTEYVKAAQNYIQNGGEKPAMLGEPYYGFYSNPWKGKTFTVPEGKSFEEYMERFDAEHGGYDGVLNWASKITGTNANLIEALALKYATTKPARLDGGGGPQRTFDGMYYSWFTVALAAMTGNSDKKGGGPGYSMMNEAGAYTFHGAYMIGGGNRLDPFASVMISMDNWADVVLTGKDERTREQVIEDLLIFNGVDVKSKPENEKLIEIDMMISCANHVVTMSNVNKNIYSLTKKKESNPSEYEVKYNVTVDHFMTTTAVYSDLVLPCTTHWEEPDGIGLYTLGDLFLKQQAVEPMFEAKSDSQIWYEVGKKLPLSDPSKNTPPIAGVGNPMQDYVASATYDAFPLNPAYNKAVDATAVKPPFAQIKANGRVNMPVPQEKGMVGMRDISPIGSLSTTTGRVNFYSPFYDIIRPGRTLDVGPRYLDKSKYSFYDGYENMLDSNGNLVGWVSPESKRKYTLQVLTDKAKNRAHTAFDNVAILKDKFPQTCKINPQDAEERGIQDGQLVYVYNDRGCLKIPAEVTDTALPGVIRVQHGGWYRASTVEGETVKIWLKLDKSKPPVEMVVPIDVGGCENILTLDKQTGANDPFIGGGIYVQGNLCEVSTTKPE